ncbi:MAG: flavin-dependent oxidoreductase [Burkholderiaceae bacterium]
MEPVLVIGAGIGGLTLALMLDRAGIPCRLFDAAPELKPLGVGINLLPHAMRELAALGLEPALVAEGIETREAAYFNRFGQLIHTEPLGRAAGYLHPQVSIHRGRLHAILLAAFQDRIGAGQLSVGHRFSHATQDADGAVARFASGVDSVRGCAAVGCDGIHSAMRRQLFPDDGGPVWSGVTMWRGTTLSEPMLSGATMVRAGWLTTGKMVIYPIRDAVDAGGRQLVNWVAELQTTARPDQDWTRKGRVDDFIDRFEDWHFDWCDVPALIRGADEVLEYPMVDKDPLPHWSHGRLTLLGDAAHPMYPRGSNGAGQAILDARALVDALTAAGIGSGRTDDPVQDRADGRADRIAAALQRYSDQRCPVTADVVRANRTIPPDAIIEEVWRRTGDRPFTAIEDVISADELQAIIDRYKRIAGYDRSSLERGVGR